MRREQAKRDNIRNRSGTAGVCAFVSFWGQGRFLTKQVGNGSMDLPQRKPTRIKHYNYGAPGAYFVTICTQGRRCVLSELVSADGSGNTVGEGLAPPVVRLTPYGTIAAEQISLLPSRFPSISVEKYVIMPNHIHLILRIHGNAAETCSAGGASPSPTATIPNVVGALKSMVTRLCGNETKLFQRSFHDHIIRDDADYRRIWEYIDSNPAKWAEDCFNNQLS